MESKPEIRNIEEKETKVYLVDFIYDNINQSDRLVDRLESGTDIKLSEGIIDGKIEEKVKSSITPSTMGADKTAKYSNIIEYFEMVSGNIKGKIMIDEEIQALDNSKGNMIDEEIQTLNTSKSLLDNNSKNTQVNPVNSNPTSNVKQQRNINRQVSL